ncbi:hypothetical protein LBMAG53_22610 [Planctomycetota bacterium]|nr:hypothetical protein LBMAG53_22610 [Planctomycetota bacterium]
MLNRRLSTGCPMRSLQLLAPALLAPALALISIVPIGAQERSEKAIAGGKPQFWPAVPDQAAVLSASFLGGPGCEWLAGGGFQPDGSVVVAGTALGPTLELPGVKTAVLGTDQAAPPAVAAKTKKNKDGKDEPVPPDWTHPQGTAFVARLDPEAKQILAAVRLPWSSGGVTGATVDAAGDIYLTGPAGPAFDQAGLAQKEDPVSPDATRKSAPVQRTYLAKIAKDLSKVLWIRSTRGLSDAPTVRLGKAGTVVYGAQDLRVYAADGALVTATVVPGGVNETTSVSPIDGMVARGGEHHWPTGREPWRCPYLHLLKPDGTLFRQLYEWPGPHMGLENCRLISDSAIRAVTHDKDGNILIYAWSDGGNSCMLNQPTDVRRRAGFPGLGLNAAGAHATSFAYLVRIEPKDFQIVGWTFWCTKYGGRANGIGIDCIALADDGAVCITGGAAWGLIQTENRIAAKDAEPAGRYLAVLSADMSRARLVSALPGTGAAILDGDPVGSGKSLCHIATGSQGGKNRALFLCGAAKEDDVYGWVSPTPLTRPLQGSFAGGLSDGWLAIVDLSAKAPIDATDEAPSQRLRLTYQRDAVTPAKPKAGDAAPPDPLVTELSPTYPKFVTIDAELRDAKNAYWPSFLYGRPISGNLTLAGGKLDGDASVVCDLPVQPKGAQDRRVLGSLAKSDTDFTKLALVVSGFSPPVSEEVTTTEKGKPKTQTVTFCTAKGTVTLAGKAIAVTPKVTFRHHAGRDGAPNGLRVSCWMTLRGQDLGLTGPLAGEDIDLKISWISYPPAPKAPPKKK